MNNATFFRNFYLRKTLLIILLNFPVLLFQSPLFGQFNGGASVTDNTLLSRAWHITNKTDHKLLVPVNGELRDNSNTLNETSTWFIEDVPDDGKWWTADKKWFAIKNVETGKYVTLLNTITSGKGRNVGFEDLGDPNSDLLTRQQFEVVLIAGDYYKIRSRVEGSSSWGKLILKCDDDGKVYAVENNLLGDRVSFAFNLALPTSNAAVYTLSGINNYDFISDRGHSADNSQLVHFEDLDQSGLWNFIQLGDADYYYIRNALTGNYISNNGDNGDNAPLIMKTSPGESEKWSLVRSGTTIRIKSKGGGTSIPQFIGVNGHPASGEQLYGAKSNVVGIEWNLIRIIDTEPEALPGDYDRIPTTDNDCTILGPQFKRALAERAGLPAEVTYFPIVEEALKQYYGGDADMAYSALVNFDLNNIGHRAELVHAVKYYLLNDVAMRSSSTWTPLEAQTINYFNQKVHDIRVNYGQRLDLSWDEFIAGQYNELSNSGFLGLLNTANSTDFQWPSDYDMSEYQFDGLTDFASASKTFNLDNSQLNFAYGTGASLVAAPFIAIIVNKLLMTGLTGAVNQLIANTSEKSAQMLLKIALKKTTSLVSTAITGGTSTSVPAMISSAIGSVGTVVSVLTTAAEVLAARIKQDLEFQRLENKVNDKIAWSQLEVNISSVMQSQWELDKLKLIADMEFLLAAPVQFGFSNNTNDNFTLEPFSISCNNITVSLDENCTAQVQPTAVSGGFVLAACGGDVSLSLSKTTFSVADIGQKQVTLTASNNIATKTCTATVTIKDGTPPTVTCKPFTAVLSASGTANIVPINVYQSGSDNCGTVNLVSVSPNSFNCGNVGSNVVTLTVNDGHGNQKTCSATVTMQDNTPPVALCKNATVPLDANGIGTLSPAQLDNGSNDACGIQSMTLSDTQFDCSHVGPNLVTLTVEDNNNKISQCYANVTLVDNVPPAALCKNVTVYLDASGNGYLAPAQMDDGSNDACGIQSMTLSDTQFDCSHVGPNLVTLTVKDNNNNISQCYANVMVVDNIPPTALCRNFTVQLDAAGSSSTTATEVNNGSHDACGIQSLNLSKSIFNCGDLGANTVTLTVKDNNNNQSTCTATVTVQDNIPPVVNCPANIVKSNDPGECSAVVNYTVTASDNCTYSTEKLSGYSSGQPFPVGLTTTGYRVTDAAGNQASCSFTVTVNKFGDPDLLYAYIIIGLDDVKLKGNTVLAGGIGVQKANKKAKLEGNTTVTAANTFVKSPQLDYSGSPAPVHYQGQFDENLLPAFLLNTNPGNNNFDLPDNSGPVTLSLGSYGKIEIGKNVIATFSGNATVLVKELTLKEGASLLFAQNTQVLIDKKLDLKKNSIVDKGTHTVWMFVEDQVSIDEGSDVSANIYTQKSLKLEKASANNQTSMTGLFIADKVDAKEFVHWNWDVAQCPFSPPSMNLEAGILTFNAQLYEEPEHLQVDLNWITDTGAGDERYEVEKSSDGSQFSTVVETGSRNENSPRHYSGYDPSLQEGDWFYRLKIVRKDGSVVYSEPRLLRIVFPENLTVFPNPAWGMVNVSLKSYASQTAVVKIVNAQGLVVREAHFEVLPENPVSLSLEGLQDGLYWLHVKAEGKRDRSVRFVVIK